MDLGTLGDHRSLEDVEFPCAFEVTKWGYRVNPVAMLALWLRWKCKSWCIYILGV